MMLPFVALALAGPQVQTGLAPSQLPRVTVRWEDPTQQEVVIVEGARYRCRVGTLPAKVLSLSVDGKELLGPGGIAVSALDAKGRKLTPAPDGITPDWNVWRGQHWQPAQSSRARMNVWSASPYYHDCHILDIPLLAEDEVAPYRAPAGPALQTFDLSKGHEGFAPLHSVSFARADGALRVTMAGEDPYLALPPVSLQGPVRLQMRLRSEAGGGGAIYWATDGRPIDGSKVTTFGVSGDSQWHDVDVTLNDAKRITTLRFDPPGESGTCDIQKIVVRKAAGSSGLPKPARGELIFHAQPDRLAIEVRVEPVDGKPAVKTILLDADGQAQAAGAAGGLLATLGSGKESAVLLAPNESVLNGHTLRMPASGQRPGAFVVLRPSTEQSPMDRMAGDITPLAAGAVKTEDGHWLGYDPIAGFYVADVKTEPGAFGFDTMYHNPTRRMRLGVDLRNDKLPREMLVKLRTGAGGLEAGVLTDPFGFMLPVAAFVSKNFGGEMEEPDDTGFGDVYFPLSVAPGEQKTFAVEPLMQNWGIWPLKQVSSIRFFLIYWHCSTGVSESTCWAMDWMPTKNAIFEIPDFRPMSGPFWPGQPQHDCQHWPGWLQYNDTKGRLCYERTEFDSVSPSLARFTMFYHTSDHTARASVQAYEAPQRDEMRTMLHLRYDWDKPCTIEGDARRGFRWLNMSHFRGRNELVLWTGPDGKTQQRAVPAKDDLVLLGQPMAAEAPFMASEGPKERYGVLTLVRRFHARLGGKEYDRPAFSAAFDAKDNSTWLTVDAQKLQLQPGDYLEADVMLMPHGEPSPPGFKAERERERFGIHPVKVTAHIGEKVADYPPQIRAIDDVAAFKLEGGHGDLPLLVEGLTAWKAPMLWTNGIWQDHQVHGGDGYQMQPDGKGGYRATFMAPHRDGQSYEFLVGLATCTGDIARIADRNGRPELIAARPGKWQLKSPAIFGPGTNHVDAKLPYIAFTGEGTSIHDLPLLVAAPQGPVDVTVETWQPERIALRVSGPAELTVSDLRSGGRYQVKIGDKTETRVAAGGVVKVAIAGPAAVEVVPAP